MEHLNRVRTYAENKFEKRFAGKYPGDEDPETIMSFQTDTWARAQQVLEHDEEADRDYPIRISSLKEVEKESSVDAGPIVSMIEGGYQFEWENSEIDVVRPFSRFGLFHLEMEADDREVGGFVFCRTPYSVTDGMVTLNIAVGYPRDLEAWVEMQALREKREDSLSNGIYRGGVSDSGLHLKELDDVMEMDAVHPQREALHGALDRFFENSEVYTRLGQKGTKKWLLVGPYGTGKTTLMQDLARKHQDERPCVFVSDVKAMAAVQKKAAENDQSVIIFVEDAEEAFKTSPMGGGPGQRGGASSSVLQLLDGVNQPANKNGCAVVMSTNHPQEIEDRILKRPGRIDHIMDIGLLEGEYAARCADLYLPDEHPITVDELAEIFDGFSGDEIRAICSSTVSMAVSEKEEEVTSGLIDWVINRMEEQLNAAEEYAQQQSDLQTNGESVGFGVEPNGEK
jgi:hypothetical protein